MPNNEYENEPNQSRSEDIISSILDGTEYDEPARSRIEYLLIQLKEAIEGGGGGGGVTSYSPLTEKPKIDNHTLQAGNNTSSDLGLQTKIDADHKLSADNVDDTNTTNKFNVKSDWNATSGASSEILNKPNLGTASAKNVPVSGDAATGEVVLGSDTRLTDARNAKDVYNWAKQSTKPTYNYSEIQNTPTIPDELSDLTEDSTHRTVTDAEKGTWSGKQDALTFDGTYSSSTNKAATVSTVTNAINALDVTGETNIAASKTIKSWSETDGKVSVTTQDIAITGTQAVLTGYSEPSTASAVVATDTVNAAIGKVEKKADDNKTNILSVADQSTQYNLINLHDPIAVRYVVPTYLPEGGVTLDVNNATLTAFNISYPAIVGIKYKFVVRITATTGLSNFHVYIRDTDSEGTNVAEYPYGINNDTINSVGTHVFEFTATATTMWIGFYPNNSGTAVTGSVTMKAQVIEKSLYDAGFTDYQPYAMSNVELTANTQIIDITSGITAASGFTKSSTTHVYKQGKHIFGTLIFKKASGSYPTTGGDTVGTMGDYAPVAQWLGGGFFSDDMWKVQSYGYAFIQSANGQSDAGNIIVTDTTSSHNYVKIQIDYVMP